LQQIAKITNARDLCFALLKADYEDEVTAVLREIGLLEDNDSWVPLGGVEANWSIVGNQQSKSVDALVDKLVNSIDAVLLSECWHHRIDPESSGAPQTMEEAVERFFGVPEGRLANATSQRRTQLASKIFLIATGAVKANPSYTIVDKGEGQSPARMPATLLSLPSSAKPYKAKIRFVQGVFNMGGTGVLPFCSPKNNYQLIISRRTPHARDPTDPTSSVWGFTIVRRRRPATGERMSRVEYLAPDGKIPSFEAQGIPVIPGKYPNPYEQTLEYGTIVKLFEYQIHPPALRTAILLDLYNELSRHFVTMAVPIRLCERRAGYDMHSYESTLSGMDVRLSEDRSNVLEQGFESPPSGRLNIPGLAELPATIYGFRSGISSEKYHGDVAVAFTINGQVHYHLGPSFLMKKRVNLDYVSDSVFVVVDCTSIPIEKREDLIMGSRDRLRFSEDWVIIEEELEQYLRHDESLQALNEKRRTEQLQKAFGDDRALESILERLLRVSPSIVGLFGRGVKLAKPTSFEWRKRMGSYNGRRFPTFFRLKPGFPTEFKCPINGARILPFETDAENHYFTRPLEAGTCTVTPSEAFVSTKLWNGIARIVIGPPPLSSPGDKSIVRVIVSDPSRSSPIYDGQLTVVVDEPSLTILAATTHQHRNGAVKRGRTKRFIEGADEETGIQLPKTRPLEKSDPEWTQYFSDDEDAVNLQLANEQIDLIYVNMSNPYLLNEMAQSPGDEVLVQNQYRVGMALATVAIYHSLKTSPESQNGALEIERLKLDLRRSLRGVAMIILLTINSISSTIRREMRD
jgi:hypothetical protein